MGEMSGMVEVQGVTKSDPTELSKFLAATRIS